MCPLRTRFGRCAIVVPVLLGLPIAAYTLPNAPNPDAIAEVAAGTRAEANAAWWGFGLEDATACLQAAIDSGARKVVVPYVGADWIVRPIRLRSGLELVFEPGVAVLAKKGEFKGRGDSLFRATNVHDVTVRGYGATLRMRKEDYQSEAYEKAEWRMTMSFTGCRNVRVEGVRLENSGGDGIYIGASGELPYCEGVVIRDVVCDGHHRQGISIITAIDLLIENCAFDNTSGTAPQAGIDLEPNSANEKLVNCVIRNCTMANNAGAGILVYLKPLDRTSDPVSIRFENCHVRSGKDQGIAVGAVKEDGPKGTVEFVNCTIENARGGGAWIYDKAAGSARVRFENCNWKNVTAREPGEGRAPSTPLLITLHRPKLVETHGGIEFIDCTVYDNQDRPAIVVEESKNGIHDLQGTIYVSNPHGARADFGPNPAGVALSVREAPIVEGR